MKVVQKGRKQNGKTATACDVAVNVAAAVVGVVVVVVA